MTEQNGPTSHVQGVSDTSDGSGEVETGDQSVQNTQSVSSLAEQHQNPSRELLRFEHPRSGVSRSD